MKNIPYFSAKSVLYVAAVALIICRMALVSRLPTVVYPYMQCDDMWVVKAAYSMMHGNWLGDYNQYTLIKGCFAPMLLAIAAILGVPYMLANTVLYVISVCFLMRGLCLLKISRVVLLIVFAMLLFNPLSYSEYLFQQIYRNGIPLWETVFIFGAFLGLLRCRRAGACQMLPYATVCAVMLAALANTREDSIWIWPVVVLFVIAILWKNVRRETLLSVLVILIFPVCVNLLITMGHYFKYGCFLRNDRDSGAYAKVIKDLYQIDPAEADKRRFSGPKHRYYNIYSSTVERAFERSSTFALAAEPIRRWIKEWDSYDVSEEVHDGEPNWDHMLWAIRDGVAEAGYYSSLPVAESFYGQVHQDLQAAFAAGTLKKRGFMLTAMAAPVRWDRIPDVMRSFAAGIGKVSRMEGVCSAAPEPNFPHHESNYNLATGISYGRTVRTYGEEAFRKAVRRCNRVARVYKAAFPYLTAFSILWWVGSVIILIGRRQGRHGTLIMLSGAILIGAFIYLACLSYIDATTFGALHYGYSGVVMHLVLLFDTFQLCAFFNWCVKKGGFSL